MNCGSNLKTHGKKLIYLMTTNQAKILTPSLALFQKRSSCLSGISENSVPKQFLSTVLLVKAPIENKQNTSKQVKFESSHVRIIHKPRTRDWGQYLSLIRAPNTGDNNMRKFFRLTALSSVLAHYILTIKLSLLGSC